MKEILKNKQALVFASLFVIFIIYLGFHINRFYVPESDFFDYRDKAISLRHLEYPENFKRPPLYSALIALFSIPLQGKFRELYSAEAIGFLSSILSLILVYKIASHFLQKHAFWLAWLWALHPTTLRMAVKPKPEILVTVLILWAFYLFLKNDKRSYLIAFLATLVRYEGALAIMAFFAADFLFTRQKIKTTIYAFASGIFIVLWTVFQSEGSEGAAYGNYFNSWKLNIGFLKNFWHGLLDFLPSSFFQIAVVFGAALLLTGFYFGFKTFKKEATAFFVFLCGFVAMHMIWPFSNIDYLIIVSWLILIVMILPIIKVAESKVFDFAKRQRIIIPFSIIIFALAAFSLLHFMSKSFASWVLAFGFMVPILIFVLQRPLHSLPVIGMALILSIMFIAKAKADFYDIYYAKSEYRKVGEWYANNYKAGEKMAVDQPIVVSFFTNLDTERDFIRLTNLPTLSPDELAVWLKENRIHYISWLCTNRLRESKDAWYNWKAENRGWKTIDFLSCGTNLPHYRLLEKLQIGPRWAYVYQIE